MTPKQARIINIISLILALSIIIMSIAVLAIRVANGIDIFVSYMPFILLIFGTIFSIVLIKIIKKQKS